MCHAVVTDAAWLQSLLSEPKRWGLDVRHGLGRKNIMRCLDGFRSTTTAGWVKSTVVCQEERGLLMSVVGMNGIALAIFKRRLWPTVTQPTASGVTTGIPPSALRPKETWILRPDLGGVARE